MVRYFEYRKNLTRVVIPMKIGIQSKNKIPFSSFCSREHHFEPKNPSNLSRYGGNLPSLRGGFVFRVFPAAGRVPTPPSQGGYRGFFFMTVLALEGGLTLRGMNHYYNTSPALLLRQEEGVCPS